MFVEWRFFILNRILAIIRTFKSNQIVSVSSQVNINEYLLNTLNSFVAACLWFVM